MQSDDLEVLKGIPGYASVLRAVLKSQIQLLVDQLCDHTGEESLLLTASVSDGTLCHLGSNRGKHFLDSREELKSAFLNHCLTDPQQRRTSRRSQLLSGKTKLTTVTSPVYSDKLFSSRVILDPLSSLTDAGNKANKAVLNLNIPGENQETVQVSLNDDNDGGDDDDNDTDDYMLSSEHVEEASQTKTKRSKRKRRKGGRKHTLAKKGKGIGGEVTMAGEENIVTGSDENEDEEIKITRFEMGGNSKVTPRLGYSSVNETEENSNQSEINSVLEETDEGFKLKLTRVKQSKQDSQVQVAKHPAQPSHTRPLEVTTLTAPAQFDQNEDDDEDPDEPPILKPTTTPKFSNEAYEKNFKSFIQEKDPSCVMTTNESATVSEASNDSQEMAVDRGYCVRNTFQCMICKKTYSTPGSLRRHEYIHIDGGPFYCNKCKRSFVNKKGLDTHYLFTDHDKT